VFDTYMDDSHSPTQALTKVSGTAVITNYRWAQTNHVGWGMLGFDYYNPPGGGATMRAVSTECENDAWFPTANRIMDADSVTPADPNDNRDWSF